METIKKLARNWKRQMAPATPCKTSKKSKHGETRGKTTEIKSKLACILEVSESTRLCMEEFLPKYHEDRIAGKGDNSLQHYNLVHKFIPMPQAMKIHAPKAAMDKEWERLEKDFGVGYSKSKTNQRWSMKQRRKPQKFILPHWWTSVIWRMPTWRQSTKNTKVELYSEAKKWKMIQGLYAVFTEQGSSVSQMTAAKIMDIISRLPGTARRTADAVSAKTQFKMERCSQIFDNSQIGMSRHLDPSTTTETAKIMVRMEDTVVPLERNLYGHPLTGLSWEKSFEKILLKYGLEEKVSNCECLFVHREKELFLSMYVDDIKSSGKKLNLDPMWKIPHEEVDLGEPTSFLDHAYLGCTQRQCKISNDIVDNYRTMFESRISAGATEKLPCSENLCISSWPYDMECHVKKCVERYCDLANKTTHQLYKVSTPYLDDHHF